MKNYNLEYVREMADGDEEFVSEMVRTFIEELPEDIRAMEEAIENHNRALAYQIAHKMKPNLQLFGLDLVEEIKRMEEWSKSEESVAEIKPKSDNIADAVMLAVKEMEEDFHL